MLRRTVAALSVTSRFVPPTVAPVAPIGTATTESFRSRLQQSVESAYNRILSVRAGKVASYIPELARVEPDTFAIAAVTVDGFVCTAGDADVPFTLQSTSKPFTAALVMDETGDPGILMDRIGVEPTSLAFNSVLATQILPVPSGNPMVNAGAIATVSLVNEYAEDLAANHEDDDLVSTEMVGVKGDGGEQLSKQQMRDVATAAAASEALRHSFSVPPLKPSKYPPLSDRDPNSMRFRKIHGFYEHLAGARLEVDEPVYHSESRTNFRNRALANLLFSSGRLYSDDVDGVVADYTRQCAIRATTKDLALMAGTLANGGIHPVSRERVIRRGELLLPRLFAVMTMSGLYDESGRWAYRVGLPAKSGVGGGMFVILPGKVALAAYSPRLGESGTSVRAEMALEAVATDLNLSIFRGRGWNKRNRS